MEDINEILKDTFITLGEEKEPSPEEVMNYFHALDWDHDGKVSKSDYICYIKANLGK